MQVTLWFVVIGVLLIAMTFSSGFVARLPLSTAMLYLLAGWGIGPSGLGLLRLDALRDARLLELLAEIAVLISLFAAGFKLELPLSDSRWRIPLQLATASMLLTVAALTAAGVWGLGLPLGGALLLAGILAPTDPVLASDVQVNDPADRDRLRFGLTGEGGLNDGTAFPFVMLGLGLLSLHPLGSGGWRWVAVDLVWAVAGGLAIGYALGAAVGQAVLWLRMRHREAVGSDEFIALGLIALTYGVALLCHAYGFLAVFAAALALRRINRDAHHSAAHAVRSRAGDPARDEGSRDAGADADKEHAAIAAEPQNLMRAVEGFNSQLERFAEVAVVLAVGALLATVPMEPAVWWFVPLLFLVIRPIAVVVGLSGSGLRRRQRGLMAWFGIRGIGSIYYLAYALHHGVDGALARTLVSVTVAVVVASVVLHGISTTPLMARYERLKRRGLVTPKDEEALDR